MCQGTWPAWAGACQDFEAAQNNENAFRAQPPTTAHEPKRHRQSSHGAPGRGAKQRKTGKCAPSRRMTLGEIMSQHRRRQLQRQQHEHPELHTSLSPHSIAGQHLVLGRATVKQQREQSPTAAQQPQPAAHAWDLMARPDEGPWQQQQQQQHLALQGSMQSSADHYSGSLSDSQLAACWTSVLPRSMQATPSSTQGPVPSLHPDLVIMEGKMIRSDLPSLFGGQLLGSWDDAMPRAFDAPRRPPTGVATAVAPADAGRGPPSAAAWPAQDGGGAGSLAAAWLPGPVAAGAAPAATVPGEGCGWWQAPQAQVLLPQHQLPLQQQQQQAFFAAAAQQQQLLPQQQQQQQAQPVFCDDSMWDALLQMVPDGCEPLLQPQQHWQSAPTALVPSSAGECADHFPGPRAADDTADTWLGWL